MRDVEYLKRAQRAEYRRHHVPDSAEYRERERERLMTDQASHEGNEPGPTISPTIRGQIGPNGGQIGAPGEGGVDGCRPAASGVTGKGAQKILTKGVFS
jgi:hypothetical protein